MQGDDIIENYEALSRITGNMLLAAENGDWDSLVKLEQNCRAMVGHLVTQAEHRRLSPSEQQRRVDVIRKILADDARIRELTAPRLSSLLDLLHGTGKAKNLARTYHEGDGY